MGKDRVRPRPKLAMPISAVVSLNPKAQRISLETPPIERNLPREKCIGMRRSGEPNPSLAADLDAKCGMILQIPRDLVSVDFQRSPTRIVLNAIVGNSQVERIFSSIADLQTIQREALNEAARLFVPRKPGCPYLQRQPLGPASTTAPPGIHQQISEPPGSASIRQAHADEPNLVAATRRERRIEFVQSLHRKSRGIILTVHLTRSAITLPRKRQSRESKPKLLRLCLTHVCDRNAMAGKGRRRR